MKKIMILIIKLYKKTLSPIFSHFGISCKYYPTCSDYAIQAFTKYGFFLGMYYSIKRIIRCNPFSKGGYDPLK